MKMNDMPVDIFFEKLLSSSSFHCDINFNLLTDVLINIEKCKIVL